MKKLYVLSQIKTRGHYIFWACLSHFIVNQAYSETPGVSSDKDLNMLVFLSTEWIVFIISFTLLTLNVTCTIPSCVWNELYKYIIQCFYSIIQIYNSMLLFKWQWQVKGRVFVNLSLQRMNWSFIIWTMVCNSMRML